MVVFTKNQSRDMIKDNDSVVCVVITEILMNYFVFVVTKCIEENNVTGNDSCSYIRVKDRTIQRFTL